MLVDFVLIADLEPAALLACMSVEGRAHIDAALEEGRGCVVAVPHMGSWDMAGSYAAALGYRAFAVAERFPGSLNRAVVETRQRFGLQVIPLGRAAVRGVQDALRQNGLVALLCDLQHGPGVEVDFFGRRAVVPGGPAAFALKTGAPVLPACNYRIAPGRYRVQVEPVIDYEPRGDHRRDVQALMQAVVTRFESFIRERPEQWYAFRPVFRSA
jgi:KDO2-lipid IV(A) lauroyltransferase